MIITFALNENPGLDFEEVYNKYKNLVWYEIQKRCINDEQLEWDIFQTFFMKFYMSRGKFQSEKAIKRWLVVVTRTTLIDMNKKECNFKRYMDISIDDEEIFEACLNTTNNAPLDEAIKREAAGKLMQEIKKLKPIHYEVIILHYFFEYTPQEIAKHKEISVNTVYSRLDRARTLLYDRIDESVREYYLGGVSNNE